MCVGSGRQRRRWRRHERAAQVRWKAGAADRAGQSGRRPAGLQAQMGAEAPRRRRFPGSRACARARDREASAIAAAERAKVRIIGGNGAKTSREEGENAAAAGEDREGGADNGGRRGAAGSAHCDGAGEGGRGCSRQSRAVHLAGCADQQRRPGGADEVRGGSAEEVMARNDLCPLAVFRIRGEMKAMNGWTREAWVERAMETRKGMDRKKVEKLVDEIFEAEN